MLTGYVPSFLLFPGTMIALNVIMSDKRLVSDKDKTKIAVINGRPPAIYGKQPGSHLPGIKHGETWVEGLFKD